jgi:LAGLIDADG endonuclease
MNHKKLTPGYITGLTQTDGSFFCSIIISNVGNIKFIPVFDITADLTSKYVLEEIHKYFGCGYIGISMKNHTASYRVTKLTDLLNIIIPHFNLHYLFCAKLHAFNLFQLIVEVLIKNKTKDVECQKKLVKMALSMNKVTLRTPERINEIYNILGVEVGANLPLIENQNKTIDTPITNDNISGIIDGDGSF